MLKKILTEPLIHFLIAGAVLFLVFDLVGPTDGSRSIVVDSDLLLDFLRLGSSPLEPDPSNLRLEDLPQEQLHRLIDNYVREEALYREARALGLDRNDAVFRRQLIRRLESINRMVVSSGVRVSEAELEDYLAAHRERYHLPPTVTFTHVFLGSDRHGEARARELADEMIETLNRENTPFHEAPSKGDRFLYHHNYVKASAAEVASHFGSEMQRQLFALEPDGHRWTGPFRSTYGYHLVLLTAKTAGRSPPLDEVRDRVEADAFSAKLEAEVDRIDRSIIDRYRVEIDDQIRTLINRDTRITE